MTSRRGGISFFSLFLILILIAGVSLVHRFGPYYWDFWQMKEITKTTARTWKMFGIKDAEAKLGTLIEDRGLVDYLDPTFCDLIDQNKGVRVQCSWEVDVYYPFSEKIRTLAFQTEHFESMDD